MLVSTHVYFILGKFTRSYWLSWPIYLFSQHLENIQMKWQMDRFQQRVAELSTLERRVIESGRLTSDSLRFLMYMEMQLGGKFYLEAKNAGTSGSLLAKWKSYHHVLSGDHTIPFFDTPLISFAFLWQHESETYMDESGRTITVRKSTRDTCLISGR